LLLMDNNNTPARKQSIDCSAPEKRKDTKQAEGAGGKGTAAGTGDLVTGSSPMHIVDKDSNNGGIVLSTKQVVPTEVTQLNAVLEIITEFIESGDLKEALADIKKRVHIDGTEFVKRTLIFGIEHKAYERELISQLLSGAYSIFESREMPDGFELLLDRLPDLVLDVPDAVDVLGKFIARAVFDEILPPVFLKEAKRNNQLALMTLSLAYELYENDRKRLEHIWGPGDLSSVRRLRKEVDALLREYLENKDINDATSAVNSLNARSFNSQIIRQVLTLALEANSAAARMDTIHLIAAFYTCGLMSPYDVKHGYELTWRKIADITLDVPNAREMLRELTQKGKEAKVLSEEFVGEGEIRSRANSARAQHYKITRKKLAILNIS